MELSISIALCNMSGTASLNLSRYQVSSGCPRSKETGKSINMATARLISKIKNITV